MGNKTRRGGWLFSWTACLEVFYSISRTICLHFITEMHIVLVHPLVTLNLYVKAINIHNLNSLSLFLSLMKLLRQKKMQIVMLSRYWESEKCKVFCPEHFPVTKIWPLQSVDTRKFPKMSPYRKLHFITNYTVPGKSQSQHTPISMATSISHWNPTHCFK